MNRQASSNNVEDISANLQQAIDQLPKIKSEKELIESHTNICTALFDKIKSRGIDEYTTVESDLMTQGYVTGAEKATFEKLLSDTENASVESAVDKARLLVMYALTCNPEHRDLKRRITDLNESCPSYNFDFIMNMLPQ